MVERTGPVRRVANAGTGSIAADRAGPPCLPRAWVATYPPRTVRMMRPSSPTR